MRVNTAVKQATNAALWPLQHMHATEKNNVHSMSENIPQSSEKTMNKRDKTSPGRKKRAFVLLTVAMGPIFVKSTPEGPQNVSVFSRD